MKTYKYLPEKESGFTGYITLEIPPYKERIQKIQELGLNDEKAIVENLGKIVDLVEKSVKEVSLSYGDFEIKSFEDLGYFSAGVEMINQLGVIVMQGIPLPSL